MKTQLKYGGLSANIAQSRGKLLYLVLVSERLLSVRLGQPCALVMCHSIPLPRLSSLQSGSGRETCILKPLDLLTVLSSTLLHLMHTFICPRSSAILYSSWYTKRPCRGCQPNICHYSAHLCSLSFPLTEEFQEKEVWQWAA